jgi:rod shape-determining protein MreD
MRSEYLWSIILFFPILLIQTTILPIIAIHGIVPDLILILLVFYSMRLGQLYGTVLGFLYGFLFDMITGSLLGSTMISLTVAGFIAGYFSNENKRDYYFKNYIFVMIAFMCSSINSVLNSFFSSVDLNTNLIHLLLNQGFLPALYTSLISFLVVFFYPKRSFES